MRQAIAMTQDQIRVITECLPSRDQSEIRTWMELLTRFDMSNDKPSEALAIQRDYGCRVRGGLSFTNLYKKLKDWEEHGPLALVHQSRVRGLEGAPESKPGTRTPIKRNREFLEFWHGLVLKNQRKSEPAYRTLYDKLRAGESIPGYGTWVDLYRRDHPGMAVPDHCPYEAYAHEPSGWSKITLMRCKPDKWALKAAREGLHAASDHLTKIPKTREGLKRCAVVQVDDMQHNVKVTYDGNMKGQRVVQLSMIDVLTGYTFGVLAKPVIEMDDGTKAYLKGVYMRYLVHYLLCGCGIPEDGCMLCGEHGTARADKDIQDACESITGGKLKFHAGGLLSQPLVKGLYEGSPKGNPRFKGLLEQFHNLLQNELADIRGQIGSYQSLGNAPESIYGQDKEMATMVMAAVALEASKPGILGRLQLPYVPYSDFMALLYKAYDRCNARRWHSMEGWEQCGFVTGQYRLSTAQAWTDIATVPQELRGGIVAAIQSNPDFYKQIRLSPAEAWDMRATEVSVYPAFNTPMLLGSSMACLCKCTHDLELVFKDASTLREVTIAGIVLDSNGDDQPLTREDLYKVWCNPLIPDKAYVADAEGRFLGVAPTLIKGRANDMETMKANLGTRQRVLAQEMKTLRPYANKLLRDRAERVENNVKEILGYDPAERLPVGADAADHFANEFNEQEY